MTEMLAYKQARPPQLDFENLISGASDDIKRACLKELSSLEKELETAVNDNEDEDIVVADYNSDDDEAGEAKDNFDDEEEHVTKNMCINPAVKKLKSLSFMNDRCIDLHKKKSKKNPGCVFRKEELLQAFKDKTLLEVADIEQLVTNGRQMKACPYYGARRAVPLAELHGFVEKYPETDVRLVKTNDSPSVSGLTKFLQEIRSPKEINTSLEATVDSTQQTSQPTMSSPLMQIESFLDALTNADQNGRIVINKQTKVGQSSLKFLMLNPAVHFVSILEKARSVIVAGGTMQPQAYTHQSQFNSYFRALQYGSLLGAQILTFHKFQALPSARYKFYRWVDWGKRTKLDVTRACSSTKRQLQQDMVGN
ncbi:ATP-dependent DNA helicase chl1 [Elysia marginata]|uniref:ATP-dependent DNA helicase chl1 n=1 Tax=Elysia marginata TaxID=1093978 RepID=A0AAV4I4K0_9GAST|nr:ATP-dependent DNA helicase chl1 [Elysia marginata]